MMATKPIFDLCEETKGCHFQELLELEEEVRMAAYKIIEAKKAKMCIRDSHKAGYIRYSRHAGSCRSSRNISHFPAYPLTVKADLDISPA